MKKVTLELSAKLLVACFILCMAPALVASEEEEFDTGDFKPYSTTNGVPPALLPVAIEGEKYVDVNSGVSIRIQPQDKFVFPLQSVGASGLPAGLTVVALPETSVEIIGVPVVGEASDDIYTFTVGFLDADGEAGAGTFCMRVYESKPVPDVDAFPDAMIGEYYDSGEIAITGGTPPYQNINTFNVPAGLTLDVSDDNSSVRLVGTPVTQTFPPLAYPNTLGMTIEVWDSTEPKILKAATLIPLTVEHPIKLAEQEIPAVEIGASYSYDLEIEGGTPPYDLSVQLGLQLVDQINGFEFSGTTISGIAQAAGGVAGIPLWIEDSSTPPLGVGVTLHLEYVNAIVIDGPPFETALVGEPYSAQWTVAGENAPFSYSLAGLPQGLSWTIPADGEIEVAGTPTQSALEQSPHLVTLTIEDSNDPAYTKIVEYEFDVVSSLDGGGVVYPVEAIGFEYGPHSMPVIRGGKAPYTIVEAVGLPEGLTAEPDDDGNVVIFGSTSMSLVPQILYLVELEVEDSSFPPITSFIEIGLELVLPPTILTSSLGVASLNQPFESELKSFGGAAPYTWAVQGLPEGLSVQYDEALDQWFIAGTATQTGSYTLSITLDDSLETTPPYITKLALQVLEGEFPPLELATDSLAPIVEGEPMAQQSITLAGGTPEYVWSEILGLPPGVDANVSSQGQVLLTGTPLEGSVGLYQVQVLASDASQPVQEVSAIYVLIVAASNQPDDIEQSSSLNFEPATSLVGGAAAGCRVQRGALPSTFATVILLFLVVVGGWRLIKSQGNAE